MKNKAEEKAETSDDAADGFKQRLAECADLVGNAATLSKMTGISRPTIGDYLSGKSDPSRTRLIQIARVANVSLEWLATGYGSRIPRGVPSLEARDQRALDDGRFFDKTPEEQAALDEANMQGFVALPVMSLSASAGGGAAVVSEHQTGVINFDRNWLHNTLRLNPANLFTMPTVGESMEPTIKAGEYLLVSRAEEHTALGDGIYIIRLEGDVLVKRLQRIPGGKLLISSDNPAYKPYEIKVNDGVDFTILGKVMLVHGVRYV